MSRDEILTKLDNLLKDSTYEELNFYLELVQRTRGGKNRTKQHQKKRVISLNLSQKKI